MLGNFNARVGSRNVDDQLWYERGFFGYGDLNEAGEQLLSFLATNEATVCNTWFKKKDIYKQTWQHPKSQKWHCIDFVITKKDYQRRCLDVSVMRGAGCNSDHRLLRAKFVVGSKRYFRRTQSEINVKRWAVSSLQGRSVDSQGKLTTKGRYLMIVDKTLGTKWNNDSTIQEKWSTLKCALCEAAGTDLGYSNRIQPDWFQDSATKIRPLIEKRNKLYSLWMSTSKERDKRKFVAAHRDAWRAISLAKEEWFSGKAEEAERGRHNGKTLWRCIRDIQKGRRGMVPVRSSMVKDEEGNVCSFSCMDMIFVVRQLIEKSWKHGSRAL